MNHHNKNLPSALEPSDDIGDICKSIDATWRVTKKLKIGRWNNEHRLVPCSSTTLSEGDLVDVAVSFDIVIRCPLPGTKLVQVHLNLEHVLQLTANCVASVGRSATVITHSSSFSPFSLQRKGKSKRHLQSTLRMHILFHSLLKSLLFVQHFESNKSFHYPLHASRRMSSHIEDFSDLLAGHHTSAADYSSVSLSNYKQCQIKPNLSNLNFIIDGVTHCRNLHVNTHSIHCHGMEPHCHHQ